MGGGRPHTEPCLCPQAPSPSPSRTCGPPWSGARGGSTRSARHTSPTSSWSAAPAFGGVPGGGQHGVTLGGGCRGVGGIVGWAAWRDIGGGGGGNVVGWHHGVGTVGKRGPPWVASWGGAGTRWGSTGPGHSSAGARWGPWHQPPPTRCRRIVHLSVRPPTELGRDALPLQAAADGAGVGVQ